MSKDKHFKYFKVRKNNTYFAVVVGVIGYTTNFFQFFKHSTKEVPLKKFKMVEDEINNKKSQIFKMFILTKHKQASR